jgi:chromosome segregation ATPase
VLADRLATLAATVSTTAASLVRKDGEIAALRKDLDDGNKRLESLVREFGKSAGAEEVEKLRAAIRAVQAERPARTSDSRVENLGAKVDYLTERVDTLAKTVGTTAAGLVGREGEIATLRQRLDEGAARIEQASTELRRMQGDGSLARQLDALQVALDTTNARLVDRETEVVALRSRIDEAYSRVGTVVAELQASLARLTSQVVGLEALPAATEDALDAHAAELGGRVDDVAEQLAALARTVETAMGTLSERQVEIGALTQRVDEASERSDLLVAELRETIAQLPEPGRVEGDVARRLEQLGGSLAAVAEQLTALAESSSAHAEATAARSAALEGLLATGGERLQALESDRDAVAARIEELAATVAEASETEEVLMPLLEALSERVSATESGRAAATAELVRISSALDAERDAVRAELDALAGASPTSLSREDAERMLAEVSSRLESLEERASAVASEIIRVSAALAAEKDSLHAQLDEVVAALAETKATADDGAESALEALSARLQSVEEDRVTAASEIARLTATVEAARESLRAELGELALAGASSARDDGLEHELAQLSSRLEAVEDGGAAVASEMARTAALWASELESIEARLDRVSGTLGQGATGARAESDRLLAELPARLDAMERARQAAASEIARVSDAWHAERADLDAQLAELATEVAQTQSRAIAASEGELAQLRIALDGLRQRLASSEQELASLAGTKDTSTRLDELTRRLESLERAPVVLAGTADGGPGQGDGRFRLELRALELRMEHTEAAARENREAVLVQLERLAARIEWRFQRLESEQEAARPQAVGGGQVVPLRPNPENK